MASNAILSQNQLCLNFDAGNATDLYGRSPNFLTWIKQHGGSVVPPSKWREIVNWDTQLIGGGGFNEQVAWQTGGGCGETVVAVVAIRLDGIENIGCWLGNAA